MADRSLLKKVGFALLFAFFSVGVFFLQSAHAQTTSQPLFLVTWKSNGSYIPSFYQGKALPSYGAKVTASLELISNGKILNLSNQTIYWYQNDVLLGGGVGVQQITFSLFGAPPNSVTLDVELPQYATGYLAHSIQIPFVDPVAVIDAPYPNSEFSTNPVALTAIPFFFNTASASNLTYTWSVNGQTGSNTENPQEAEVTLPQGTQSGTSLDISLSIKNPNDSTVATAEQNLTYQSQL
jgi:P pilus assembly chaperone PapD